QTSDKDKVHADQQLDEQDNEQRANGAASQKEEIAHLGPDLFPDGSELTSQSLWRFVCPIVLTRRLCRFAVGVVLSPIFLRACLLARFDRRSLLGKRDLLVRLALTVLIGGEEHAQGLGDVCRLPRSFLRSWVNHFIDDLAEHFGDFRVHLTNGL